MRVSHIPVRHNCVILPFLHCMLFQTKQTEHFLKVYDHYIQGGFVTAPPPQKKS